MSDALKACPFCGSDDVHIVDAGPGNWVSCLDCDADGPVRPTIDEATAGWKTRAAPPSAAEQWKPSGAEYDRNIHHNTDASAWADFFMATFPNCGADRDTMLGWFANAMMAVADSRPSTAEAQETYIDTGAVQIGGALFQKHGWSPELAQERGLKVIPLYRKASEGEQTQPSTAEAVARALIEFAIGLKQQAQQTHSMFSEGLLHAARYAEAEAKRIREEG